MGRAQLETVTGALDWNLDADTRAVIDNILRRAIANPVGSRIHGAAGKKHRPRLGYMELPIKLSL